MSELINTHDTRATIRWKLLTSASALALTAYVSTTALARAEGAARPTIWIELGGDLDMMQGLDSPFTAPFMTANVPTPDVYQGNIFIKGQRAPRYALGLDGKISFQPEDSDWIFSAGIRYGRGHRNSHIHQQDALVYYTGPLFNFFPIPRYAAAFADTQARYSEQHAILDFSAGKDVGVGALGHDGTSTISAGVRFADFTSRSGVNIHARPYVPDRLFQSFHGYTITAHAARDFKGVGPSLSWDASAGLAGNKQDGELSLDWGIKVAVLFGRQKARTDHKGQAYFYPPTGSAAYYYTKQVYPPHHSTRSKRVTVPNIGGYAGLSFRWTNAKISIGYRYDTFLKAMDTGIDAAKKSNLTFNGPYASISIGLGD